MAATWHPDADVTPTPKDVESMASVLEDTVRRFGRAMLVIDARHYIG